ncbi:MAG: recombination protein NinG [archaeon]|nr:recombination protein NinG [archaeon]
MKSVSSLKKKVWKVFSEYIRQRDSDWRGYGKCYTCGKNLFWKEGDAGHFISRVHNNTLFDEVNCHLQCKHCNNQAGEPAAYALHLIKDYGEDIISLLEKKSKKIRQFKIIELEALILVYKGMTEKLNK